jgi:hypothetical protein
MDEKENAFQGKRVEEIFRVIAPDNDINISFDR